MPILNIRSFCHNNINKNVIISDFIHLVQDLYNTYCKQKINIMVTNAIYNRPKVSFNHNAHTTKSTRVAYNTFKNETHFEIHLAIPGIPKEEVAIEIDEHKLNIKHNASESNKENTSQVIARGFDPVGFHQKFNIPENVEAEKITASHDLGILKITLPIKEKYHKKSIEVK